MNIQEENNDSGCFTYEDDGFTYIYKSGPVKIRWLDIDQIIAYKVDLMTVDEITMEIIYGNSKTTITEEIPGWNRFVTKLKSIFPSIDGDWDIRIIQQPFATNLLTLYKKDYYKLFADFNNSDVYGRVRLNTTGSLQKIHELGDNFRENIYVLLDDAEGLNVFGLIKYSDEERIWVAEISDTGFITNEKNI